LVHELTKPAKAWHFSCVEVVLVPSVHAESCVQLENTVGGSSDGSETRYFVVATNQWEWSAKKLLE